MSLWKWLGLEKRIDQAVLPAMNSLDERLTRLTSSHDTLIAEVAQIKRLVDVMVSRNSLC